MKIDCISDTHTAIDLKALDYSDAELLIIAGDILNAGYNHEAKKLFKQLNKLPHKYVLYVPGNHDRCLDPDDVLYNTHSLPRLRKGIFVRRHQIIEIEGLKIGCSSYTPEFCGWAFMKEEEDLAEMWEAFKSQDLDILVTHGPAYGILDESIRKDRCGSKSLLDALPEIDPKFHIFGHIHEAQGKLDSVKGTKFRNVSICNRLYEPVNPVTTIEV